MRKAAIKLIYLAVVLDIICCITSCNYSSTNNINTLEIAIKTASKGEELVYPGNYMGILIVQAMAEIAVLKGKGEYLDQVHALCSDFGTDKITARGNFICYEAGGTGSAYLVYKGLAPELKSQVVDTAFRMMEKQPRSSEGLMTRHRENWENDPIFIDVAFATTPFLLYTGLILEHEEFINSAIYETLERINILRDEQTGLVHQARGFQGKGVLTEDCWSRGNGWASVGLAALIRDLPENHPRRSEVESTTKDFFEAVLRFQNPEGLWHQEMTDFTSYVETSGSGLLLYGLGISIENNILDESYLPYLIRGLTNYLAYVTEDGSISNTCRGTLAPGEGKKDDYVSRTFHFNEPHSFGAAALAYVQAAKMGITELNIPFELGYLVVKDDH